VAHRFWFAKKEKEDVRNLRGVRGKKSFAELPPIADFIEKCRCDAGRRRAPGRNSFGVAVATLPAPFPGMECYRRRGSREAIALANFGRMG
jgi:hypothetical protein